MGNGQDVFDDGVLRITRIGSPPVLAIADEIDPRPVATPDSLREQGRREQGR